MYTAPTLHRRALLRASATLPLLAIGTAWPQSAYPNRAVRVIVPYAPGGALDAVARAVEPLMSQLLGQALIVENRPGAFTMLGTDLVSKAQPDGYTLLLAGAPHVLNSALGLKLRYDPLRDFNYLSLLARIPCLFIVHPSVPARSLNELIEYSKLQSDGLQFASAGVGSMPHILGEHFFRSAGVKAQHIGYKGSSQALQDLIGGQVKIMIDTPLASAPLVSSGRVRAIALASARRSEVLPDVPTVAESGFPGFEAYAPIGVLAPAGTPHAIIQKLNGAFVGAIKSRNVRASLTAAGYEVIGSTPTEYLDFVKQQIAHWHPVVKEGDIRVDQ